MSENDTVEQSEVTEKPKRRPGRPRKTDAEKAAAAEAKKAAAKAESEAPVDEKPKRRVGRPRKADAEKAAAQAAPEAPAADTDADKPKRKPGRPRKTAAEKAAAEAAAPEAPVAEATAEPAADDKPKRRPGRPRKADAEQAAAAEAAPAAPAPAEPAPASGAKQAAEAPAEPKPESAPAAAPADSGDADEGSPYGYRRRRNRDRNGQDRNGNGNDRNGKNNRNDRNNKNGRNRNRNRREVVEPQVNRDELAALKVAELRAKAVELGVDHAGVKKAELVDLVYEAAVRAEGFVEVRGILDIAPEGNGYLRTSGYLPGKHDAFVGQAMVRRYGLRKGDELTGQLRPAREGDKYPGVQRLDTINGAPADEATSRARVKFADLTPIYPDERLVMEHGKNSITARTIDLVAPIGKGQRGLIVSPPKAGKTTVLKDIAAAISANNPSVHLMCLLVDERPEEVTDMQRSIKGEVIASTFDMPSDNHITVSELVIERAKRLVEMGQDVVILLDSITRLARAYNLAQPASGRILSGGVDSTALYPPKRFLGAARNIEHGGSLTILASALIDTGSKMDEVIFEEFKGTGNMELKLDRNLADRRIFPAIDVVASGTRKEELLLDPQEQPFVWGVRQILANMNNTERATDMLIKSLKRTETNAEFLIRTARKAQKESLDV